MKLRRFLSMALAVTIVMAVNSCSKSKNYGGGGEPEPPTNGSNINITSTSFPPTMTVKKGTTVKWTNNDNMAHTVTSDDGTSFSSGNLGAGASFSYTANTVGSFPYHCSYHQGMKGTLEVTN